MNVLPFVWLASASPRRRALLAACGLRFETIPQDVDESFPPEMPVHEIGAFLSLKKANSLPPPAQGTVLLAADTTVLSGGQFLGKPTDAEAAAAMLRQLSGTGHTVITGVTLRSAERVLTFQEETTVIFRGLSPVDISDYVQDAKPFDKAGAYGIQECMDMSISPCSPEEQVFLRRIDKPNLYMPTGPMPRWKLVDHIRGSYFNVVGLPIHRLYAALASMAAPPAGR